MKKQLHVIVLIVVLLVAAGAMYYLFKQGVGAGRATFYEDCIKQKCDQIPKPPQGASDKQLIDYEMKMLKCQSDCQAAAAKEQWDKTYGGSTLAGGGTPSVGGPSGTGGTGGGCPPPLTVGSKCDDGKKDTCNDKIQPDCSCKGGPPYKVPCGLRGTVCEGTRTLTDCGPPEKFSDCSTNGKMCEYSTTAYGSKTSYCDFQGECVAEAGGKGTSIAAGGITPPDAGAGLGAGTPPGMRGATTSEREAFRKFCERCPPLEGHTPTTFDKCLDMVGTLADWYGYLGSPTPKFNEDGDCTGWEVSWKIPLGKSKK